MFDPSRPTRLLPNFAGTACENLSRSDRDQLWDAATRLIDTRGIAVSLTARLSQNVVGISGRISAVGRRVLGQSWSGMEARVQAAVERMLWRAHDVATIGVGRPGARAPSIRLHRLSASFSGALSGFAGLPGLLLDIPVTTGLLLRSIAEIARDHGEDIASPEGKRACLEVLAQTDLPRGDLIQTDPAQGEDEAEIGYWSARAGLSHLTIAVLIRTAASRLGVTLSEKLLAQSVPVAGAVAGAGLNWVFMRYYQERARVHFTIRAVERRTGDPDGVRTCFDRLVAQARILRHTGAMEVEAKRADGVEAERADGVEARQADGVEAERAGDAEAERAGNAETEPITN
jgi:hypothetical protein